MALRAEIGEGRTWAVVAANQAVHMRPEDGISACVEHANAAMDIWSHVAAFTSGKNIGPMHRYGRAIHNACTGWSGLGEELLPDPHADLGLLEGSSKVHGGKVINDYRPDTLYPSTAMNRLRVVRLALPEILRGVDKPSSLIKSRVGYIAATVEPISGRPAQRKSQYNPWANW